MSRVRRLANAYARYIGVPWQLNAAAAQRVAFCIYQEEDELRLRASIGEFELLTRQAGHDWLLYDLTDSFALWFATQRYAVKYYADPSLLVILTPKYRAYIRDDFTRFVQNAGASANTVVAVKGAGALYGFLKVREVVDDMAPLVAGRLLVFFPGAYESNNYRLLDAYDGWNYLAVPITADKE
ncbi:MAG: BREX protein BrxB domain-containing protein [Caldilinea sp.]